MRLSVIKKKKKEKEKKAQDVCVRIRIHGTQHKLHAEGCLCLGSAAPLPHPV